MNEVEKLSEGIRERAYGYMGDQEGWLKIADEIESLENELNTQKTALSELGSAFDDLKREKDVFEAERDYWRRNCYKLREDLMKIIFPPLRTVFERMIDEFEDKESWKAP